MYAAAGKTRSLWTLHRSKHAEIDLKVSVIAAHIRSLTEIDCDLVDAAVSYVDRNCKS